MSLIVFGGRRVRQLVATLALALSSLQAYAQARVP